MAQSSNLTISVGIDTAKLRADAALVKEELRKVNQEVTAAAKAQDTARLAEATKQQDTLIRQYSTLTRMIRENTAATTANAAATKTAAAAHGEAGRSLSQVLFGTRATTVSLETLAEASTRAVFGVRALRLGFAGLALELSRRAFTDAVDDINKLRQASEAIRAPVQTIQAFGEAIAAAGGDAGDAVPVLQKLADVANQARQKVLEAGGTLGGPAIARGGAGTGGIVDFGTRTTDVLRGASAQIVQFTDNLKQGLGIDIALPRYQQFDNLLTDIARGLVKLNTEGKIDEANLRSSQLLGRNFEELKGALEGVGRSGGLDELKRVLAGRGALITPEQIENARQYKDALSEFQSTLQGLQRTIVTEFAPQITKALRELSATLKTPAFKTEVTEFLNEVLTLVRDTRHEIELIKQLIGGVGAVARESLKPETHEKTIAQRLADPTGGELPFMPQQITRQEGGPAGIASPGGAEVPILPEAAPQAEAAATKTESAWTEAIAQIQRDLGALGNVFTTLWSGVTSDAQSAADSVAKVADEALAAARDVADLAASSGADVTGGFASGGYVRGPGTGRSDSILARLSNGEFVVNAASVRALGVGFLQGLNNFASGGLVTPPLRFAEGGLVAASASSGRPVHLHLGGQSYALAGSAGVVDALVSHANAQQMRSAGVKPSWFAGRPGGR